MKVKWKQQTDKKEESFAFESSRFGEGGCSDWGLETWSFYRKETKKLHTKGEPLRSYLYDIDFETFILIFKRFII